MINNVLLLILLMSCHLIGYESQVLVAKTLRGRKEKPNQRAEDKTDLKYFDDVYERTEEAKPINKEKGSIFRKSNQNLADIQSLLDQVLTKIGSYRQTNRKVPNDMGVDKNVQDLERVLNPLWTRSGSSSNRIERGKWPRRKRNHWGDWTEWSTCSVTCGKGRKIRWRHCVSVVCNAETEMEELTCQLPECSPFGILR